MFPPLRVNITPGKFANVDMRVARVIDVQDAAGTNRPSRVLTLDFGPLGVRTSIGQFAMVPKEELLDRLIVVCVNLGERQIGDYTSQGLSLGTLHPDSPDDQEQAIPLYAHPLAQPGQYVF